jgi:hypothetical protein
LTELVLKVKDHAADVNLGNVIQFQRIARTKEVSGGDSEETASRN